MADVFSYACGCRAAAGLVFLGSCVGVACASRPPNEPVPPEAAAVPSVQAYETSECSVLSHNYGDWQPTVGQVVNAADRLATGLCYNYWEIDPRRFATTVQKCTGESRSATVRLVVPLATSTGEGACDVELRSISWSGRTWLWVRSSYQRNAQFGTQVDVVELRGDGLSQYATAMMCEGDRAHAMESNSPPIESGNFSAAMASDWRQFPPGLRAFFCTAELLGPDLTQGE